MDRKGILDQLERVEFPTVFPNMVDKVPGIIEDPTSSAVDSAKWASLSCDTLKGESNYIKGIIEKT